MKEGTLKEAPAVCKLSVVVHPELRKALKVAAAIEEMRITEKVHVILCHEFGRLDLLQQVPDAAHSTA